MMGGKARFQGTSDPPLFGGVDPITGTSRRVLVLGRRRMIFLKD